MVQGNGFPGRSGLLLFHFPVFMGSFEVFRFDITASSFIAISLDFSWDGVILLEALGLVMNAKYWSEVGEIFNKSTVSFTYSFGESPMSFDDLDLVC